MSSARHDRRSPSRHRPLTLLPALSSSAQVSDSFSPSSDTAVPAHQSSVLMPRTRALARRACAGNYRVNSQSATSAFLSLSFDTRRALPTIIRQVDWTFKGVLPKTDFNGVHAVRRFGIVVHLQPTGDLAYTTSHPRTYPPRDTTATTWLARPTPTRWSENPELPERRGRVSPRRKSTTDVLLSCSERASPGSGGSSCTEARLVALLLMTKTEQADSSARASESPAGQPARNCSRAS